MDKIPARTGIDWIRQGFGLFRKQPAELALLFLCYMLLIFTGSLLPFVGPVLPLALVPTFSMSFMQACVDIEQGRRVSPALLLAGFRSPAFGTLLQLGGLYLLAVTLAVSASALADGGAFWRILAGSADRADLKALQTDLTGPLVAFLAYLPFAMALWHAAALASWQRMGLFKSMFYSFFAVRRCALAFVAYGLGWIVIGFALPLIVSAPLAMLLDNIDLIQTILTPLWIVLTIAMYCSFYPTYVQVFGRPTQQ